MCRVFVAFLAHQFSPGRLELRRKKTPDRDYPINWCSASSKVTSHLESRDPGFGVIQEDTIEKVRGGISTLDEVLRVVPFETDDRVPVPHAVKV
jgi:hypothetical protein